MPNVIDEHKMDSEVVDEEGLDNPTATCTYDTGPDVTLTVGKHVAVKMTLAETVNLIVDLQAAVDEFTKKMEVFAKHYDKLH